LEPRIDLHGWQVRGRLGLGQVGRNGDDAAAGAGQAELGELAAVL
jgi:hypothetical protein